MKFRPWMSVAATATLALGLFCFGPSPAAADNEVLIKETQTSSDWGALRYKLYQYPGKNHAFFMYPKSYITYDIVNGKWFQVDHIRAETEINPANNPEHVFMPIAPRPPVLRHEKLTVTLYTPDMKVLGVFPDVRLRNWYNIPRDGNDYERLICKVECQANENIDFKMRVWNPIDPVMAEPLPNERFRY